MFFNFPQPLKVTEEQLIEVFHTQCCKKTGLALCVMMPENIGYGATTKSRITGKTFMSLPKVVVLKQRAGSLVRGGSTAGDVNFLSFFFMLLLLPLLPLFLSKRSRNIHEQLLRRPLGFGHPT